jgi:hypothetical protein
MGGPERSRLKEDRLSIHFNHITLKAAMEHREGLVCHCPAPLRIKAQGTKFFFHPAGTNAESHPPSRQVVHGRNPFGSR